MRLIFASQLPENPCYSTGQCCSSLRTARARNRICSRSFVRRTIFSHFGLGRCCSATGAPIHGALPVCLPSESCQICKTLVFLVRPKSHSAGCSFIQQNEPHETNFCSHSANFPKIHAASRDRNRFPALVRSSVEPFLVSRILVKYGKTLLFSNRYCSAS